MTLNNPPNAPDARRAGVSKLLIGSLALNLLFVGLIAGAAVARHNWRGRPEMSLGDPSLRGFMHQLPKERREAIRAANEPLRQTWRPMRQAVQQAREAYNQAIYAVPVDLPSVERALGDLITAETAARRAGIPLLIGAISQMTPDERARFQEFRRNHEPRHPGRGPQNEDRPAPPK